MNVLFLTKNLSGNSTGRTYSLWLAAELLGWRSRTLSLQGGAVWGPLQGTAFSDSCALITGYDPARDPELLRAIDWADIVVIVKPVDSTLGLYDRHPELFNKPVLLDIDDPDLESALSVGHPVRAAGKLILRHRAFRSARRRAALARELETMVSNPVLQRAYGGTIVPHARHDQGAGSAHTRRDPHVAFVGTNNPHKGIDVLRSAVSSLSPRGFRLTITDTAPNDAQPWENWIGRTTLDEGIDLVRRCDIVALPSSAHGAFARGQLPAKLMDAMLAGRAIVASNLEPIAWALDGTGVLIEPGNRVQLEDALAGLTDPDRREVLGSQARRRALDTFEVGPVAAQFSEAVARAQRAFGASAK